MPFQWIILDAQWSKIERFSFEKLSLHSERCSASLLLRALLLRSGAGRDPSETSTARLNSSWEHGWAGEGLLDPKPLSRGIQGADGSQAWDAAARFLLAALVVSPAWGKPLGLSYE